jgi:hypothetical protein
MVRHESQRLDEFVRRVIFDTAVTELGQYLSSLIFVLAYRYNPEYTFGLNGPTHSNTTDTNPKT